MWNAVKTQVENLVASQLGLHSTFQWRGKSLSGVRTTLRRDDVATDAGLAGEYSYSLLVPASAFDDVPLPQPRIDKLTVDGIPMRVLAVERDSVGATIRIHLGAELQ